MVAATGLGSGLDIESLVSGLVGAERVPQEQRLFRQESGITSILSGLGQLQGALSGIQPTLTTLLSDSTYAAYTATSSQTSAASMSIASSGNVATGTYALETSNLAVNQSLTSGTFAATDTVVGTGTLTITIGTPTYSGSVYSAFAPDAALTAVDIDIDSSNNTLSGIRDSINAADAGINASLVKDGSDYRLLITAENTGVANSVSISVDEDGDGTADNSAADTDASGLSQLAFNATAAQLTQSAAAEDAAFTLNGLGLSSSSNTLTDVLDGVTITLKEETTSPVTLTVASNPGAITSAVQAFVAAYNAYAGTATSLTRYDATTQTAGALQGDATARSVIGQIRSTLSTSIATGGTYTALAELGITTNADGTLALDADTLNAAIAADPAAVKTLFAGGTVNSTEVDGVADLLDTLLDGYLGSGGVFESRTDILNTRIDDIADQREVLDRRMLTLEARYRAEFNALDSLLAQLTSTGDFLLSQLDSLPGFNSGSERN
ncbi:MAG: flagellar filament capping protein FliD [Luminiphilus sp.]|nr:flagellar filament capping protein FliD [Luminiphilus sp.]